MRNRKGKQETGKAKQMHQYCNFYKTFETHKLPCFFYFMIQGCISLGESDTCYLAILQLVMSPAG